MSKNMMNQDHLSTNKKSRAGWEATFGKPGQFDRCIICEDNPRYGGNCKKLCVQLGD